LIVVLRATETKLYAQAGREGRGLGEKNSRLALAFSPPQFFVSALLTCRLKIFIYFLLWIIAMAYRNTDLSLILIITQIFFSGEIIISFIKIEIRKKEGDK